MEGMLDMIFTTIYHPYRGYFLSFFIAFGHSKVKCMICNLRQQISLLKMLTKLEELDVTEDDVSFGASFLEKNRQRLSSGAGGVQTSESIEKSSVGTAFAEDNLADVQDDEDDENSTSNATIVCLEIISNWGHADIVGLTEVIS